jgi:hypothetical protein
LHQEFSQPPGVEATIDATGGFGQNAFAHLEVNLFGRLVGEGMAHLV